MDKTQYIENPCTTSPLSYWKSVNFRIPDNIKAVSEVIYRPEDYENCEVIKYFRLCHRMENINKPEIPEGFYITKPTLKEFSSHIGQCYEKESVTGKELQKYKERPTYDDSLWIGLKDKKSGELIASAIAEADREINEGYIEWIQVNRQYRKRGLGKYLLEEILYLMKGKVDFVTVSGKADDADNPEKLYTSCGFSEKVIWNIIMKNENPVQRRIKAGKYGNSNLQTGI